MSNIYCLYWVPGSGGDMVSQLLISSGKFVGAIDEFEISTEGRASPAKLNEEFMQLFPAERSMWYFRSWLDEDIDNLKTLASKSEKDILIGTHDISQLKNIKSKIPNCITLGITYPQELFPAVLKNWCKKVAATDDALASLYKTKSPHADAMIKKNMFGQFVLKEQLKFGTNVLTEVANQFDIAIDLGDMYNNDISAINRITHVQAELYNNWLASQDNLYKFSFPVNKHYVLAVGYNYKATTQNLNPIPISIYDQILIANKTKLPVMAPKTNTECMIFFDQVQKG